MLPPRYMARLNHARRPGAEPARRSSAAVTPAGDVTRPVRGRLFRERRRRPPPRLVTEPAPSAPSLGDHVGSVMSSLTLIVMSSLQPRPAIGRHPSRKRDSGRLGSPKKRRSSSHFEAMKSRLFYERC